MPRGLKHPRAPRQHRGPVDLPGLVKLGDPTRRPRRLKGLSRRVRTTAGSAGVVAFAAAVGYKETVGLVDEALHAVLTALS